MSINDELLKWSQRLLTGQVGVKEYRTKVKALYGSLVESEAERLLVDSIDSYSLEAIKDFARSVVNRMGN